uniref:ATP-dependent Clp protease proteolytic subunit n=1 Tax=Geranium phaeum TaxID=379952 RepID=A0A165TVP1_9ROSI|nr:ATP-dependent Clp protease proteolytic subunit [Geranium phaeum]
MPIGVPKVDVPYDDEGKIPIRYHYHRKKKRRVEALDKNKEKEKEKDENLDDKTHTENPNNNTDSDTDVNYNTDSDTDVNDYEPSSQEPYKARVDDVDPDDSPYEAAKKRKKKQEEEETNWYDLLEVLYCEGLIFIGQEITKKLANSVVGLMVYLDQEDQHDRHPTMFINSPGGFALGGLAIYDTLDLVRGKAVQTIAIGIAASIASVVLIGGGLRVAMHNATVMIRQPRMKVFRDEASEIVLESRILLDLRNSITEIYVRKTGKTHMCITRDLEVEKFMTAKDAENYGIIDGVAAKKTDDTMFDLIFS